MGVNTRIIIAPKVHFHSWSWELDSRFSTWKNCSKCNAFQIVLAQPCDGRWLSTPGMLYLRKITLRKCRGRDPNISVGENIATGNMKNQQKSLPCNVFRVVLARQPVIRELPEKVYLPLFSWYIPKIRGPFQENDFLCPNGIDRESN